jgi:chromosome segregation ATPase
MAQNQQFLQDFQDNMNKLNGMNQKIQESLIQKKEFSDKLVAKLKDINSKIQGLANQINQLKTNVDELKGNVNNNSNDVNDKDKQISELKQRISSLENEKQQMSQQLEILKKQNLDEKTSLQEQIDNNEAQIRKLTQDNEAIKNQANDLANKGNMQSEQNKDLQQKLSSKEQNNQAQIDGLMNKIKEQDDKMIELQKELQNKTDEISSHAKNVTENQAQAQNQINQLNQEISELKNENNILVQRIVDATQAIKTATENLEALANSVPNAESEQYINQLFSEIEKSIQNISGVIQGKQQNQGNQTIQAMQPNQMINIPQIGGPSMQISYANLLAELSRKASQGGNVQKYIDALSQSRQAKTNDEISTVLNKNNISLKNGKIMGGRKNIKNKNKTKKIKKQTGGFTYKASSKRRSVSTSSISKRRSINSKTSSGY